LRARLSLYPIQPNGVSSQASILFMGLLRFAFEHEEQQQQQQMQHFIITFLTREHKSIH
jgi:deferrochelatase/peroxidase EfeB